MQSFINPFFLAFSLGILLFGLGVAFTLLMNQTKTYTGFNKWGLSAFFLAFASFMIGAREQIPDFFSLYLGNFLAIAGLLLINRGIYEFFEQKLKLSFDIALMVGFVTLHSYLSVTSDVMHARILAVSFFHALALGKSFKMLYQQKDATQLVFLPILLFSLGSFVLLNLIRGCINIWFLCIPSPGSDKTLLGISFIILNPIVVLIYFSLLASNFRRTQESLIHAKNKIKTLFGILPICSHCKRIRTVQNDWLPVEVYVQRNSEANFSHGICPECLKENFPEFIDDSD